MRNYTCMQLQTIPNFPFETSGENLISMFLSAYRELVYINDRSCCQTTEMSRSQDNYGTGPIRSMEPPSTPNF